MGVLKSEISNRESALSAVSALCPIPIADVRLPLEYRAEMPIALDSPYIQVYDLQMQVVWDRTKARQNVAKHGVRFADAVLVLDDPYAITVADNESSPTEARWVTLGADAQGRVLVVVYTYRGEDIRLISARPAESRELKEYEAQG